MNYFKLYNLSLNDVFLLRTNMCSPIFNKKIADISLQWKEIQTAIKNSHQHFGPGRLWCVVAPSSLVLLFYLTYVFFGQVPLVKKSIEDNPIFWSGTFSLKRVLRIVQFFGQVPLVKKSTEDNPMFWPGIFS